MVLEREEEASALVDLTTDFFFHQKPPGYDIEIQNENLFEVKRGHQMVFISMTQNHNAMRAERLIFLFYVVTV